MANIIDQLDSLIKSAQDAKVGSLKKTAGVSADLDNIPDGTKPASTGTQAAANVSAANEMYPADTVDTGAKDNAVGGSVEASTEGAAAASINGQEGADGAELDVTKEADNGTEKVENKIASARAFALELRKVAEARVSPLDRFLIEAAKSSAHPLIKQAMEAMDDEATADASADVLMEALQSGEIGEDEAAQILQEALQSGAITEEDLQGAAGDMGGAEAGADPMAAAGGDPMAAAGDMMAAGAPEVVDEQAVVDPSAGVADETMETKLASANIGPDSDEYLTKLAGDYSDYVAAGYALGTKIAEAHFGKKAEEEEAVAEEKGEGESVKEEAQEGPKGEEVEEQVEEAGPSGDEAAAMEMMGMPAASSPEEEAALAAVQQELGLSPEDAAALMSAEAPQMDKIASFKTRARIALLSKVAALQG
jgi:hypothetical protein